MPLPEKAFECLPYALLALKTSGGWIHYYDFEHATKTENPVEKLKAKVAKRLESSGVDFELSFARVVRATGPNWYQIVLDICVKSLDKFNKQSYDIDLAEEGELK
jgi:tRNA G37 N-methylase Trm5